MIKVYWHCPDCDAENSNNADEIENYAQFCSKCGKEFYVNTDGLHIITKDIKAIED